ncbi:MAG: hypothetical protein Q9221_003733 [Calogaya cf. arnoldii]
MGYGAQSGQEPLSGQTGRGTADEPYDSGNVAGQSGAPSSLATSTNPTGTTQFDTGTDAKGDIIGYTSADDTTSSSQYTTGENNTTSGYGGVDDTTNTFQYSAGDNNTTTGYGSVGDTANTSQYSTGDKNASASETLAAGVAGDSHGFAEAPGSNQPLRTSTAGDTSGAAQKGTDETRGADEQVASEHSRPTTDNNHNAQDTFFRNAGMSKVQPADPPKVGSEVADKDPFSSSGGASSNDTSNEPTSSSGVASSNAPSDEPTGQSAAPFSSNTTPGAVGGSHFDNISSTAPDKNYKTVDTEPHPQSSEVLSSATPGAAIGSEPRSQTSGYDNSTMTATGASGYDNSTTTATGASGYGNDSLPDTGASIHDNTTTTTGERGYGNEPTTSSGYDNTPNTTTTTTAAAADTDYPSPKTQPTESAGGLAGVSHNTGSAPSAPDTGVSDSSLQKAASHGASETHGGEGKMKMSDKIKEKLHMGKK